MLYATDTTYIRFLTHDSVFEELSATEEIQKKDATAKKKNCNT